MPIIVAAGLGDPTVCLRNAIPTLIMDKLVNAPCSSYGKSKNISRSPVSLQIPAVKRTRPMTRQRRLSLSRFEGPTAAPNFTRSWRVSFSEHMGIQLPIISRAKEPFFDSGHVYKFFYDAFLMLWHEGIESSVRSLKYLYPDYDVWVRLALVSLKIVYSRLWGIPSGVPWLLFARLI